MDKKYVRLLRAGGGLLALCGAAVAAMLGGGLLGAANSCTGGGFGCGAVVGLGLLLCLVTVGLTVTAAVLVVCAATE